MVGTVVAAPELAGVSLATELYSPSLDTHQRVALLAVLASAAGELATARGTTRAGGLQGPSQRAALAGAPGPSPGPTPPSRRVGTVVWRAGRALSRMEQQASAEPLEYTNRCEDGSLSLQGLAGRAWGNAGGRRMRQGRSAAAPAQRPTW